MNFPFYPKKKKNLSKGRVDRVAGCFVLDSAPSPSMEVILLEQAYFVARKGRERKRQGKEIAKRHFFIDKIEF